MLADARDSIQVFLPTGCLDLGDEKTAEKVLTLLRGRIKVIDAKSQVGGRMNGELGGLITRDPGWFWSEE